MKASGALTYLEAYAAGNYACAVHSEHDETRPPEAINADNAVASVESWLNKQTWNSVDMTSIIRYGDWTKTNGHTIWVKAVANGA